MNNTEGDGAPPTRSENARNRTQSTASSRPAEGSQNRADEPNSTMTESTASDVLGGPSRTNRRPGIRAFGANEAKPREQHKSHANHGLWTNKRQNVRRERTQSRWWVEWSTRTRSEAVVLWRRARKWADRTQSRRGCGLAGLGANEPKVRRGFGRPQRASGRLGEGGGKSSRRIIRTSLRGIRLGYGGATLYHGSRWTRGGRDDRRGARDGLLACCPF